MKNLINRKFTAAQREDVIGMAENEDHEVSFSSIKKAFIEMQNQTGLRNDKKAYSAKDSMYQSISDSYTNFTKTGRYQ